MKAKLTNIDRFLHYFNGNNIQLPPTTWVETAYVTMIKAYQEKTGIKIAPNNDYALNMLKSTFSSNNTYSPVETIEDRKDIEKISNHITSVMLQNFSFLPDEDIKDLKGYLQYLFSELMNNVTDHSGSYGYAMAQYFPINKKIQFAIVDNGVGFLRNMRLNYNVKNEKEAVLKALERGVTSTMQMMYNQNKNAGYGLYAMTKILEETGGRFVIISNNAMVQMEDGKIISSELKHKWEGSIIAFEFNEKNINLDITKFLGSYVTYIEDEDEEFF